MKVLRNRKIIVLLIFMLAWCAFFTTDFIRANQNQQPIFAFPIFGVYRDGGSGSFFGLGYRVNVYMNMSAYNGRVVENVDIGTWFMPFHHPRYSVEVTDHMSSFAVDAAEKEYDEIQKSVIKRGIDLAPVVVEY